MSSYFIFSFFSFDIFIAAGDTDENTFSEPQECDEAIGKYYSFLSPAHKVRGGILSSPCLAMRPCFVSGRYLGNH